MKIKPRLFLYLGPLAVLIASCAPAAVTQGPALPENSDTTQQGLTPVSSSMEVTPTAPLVDAATATPIPIGDVPTALPIATSRGPNLEASDPSMVSLANGEIQFIEFFRFT